MSRTAVKALAVAGLAGVVVASGVATASARTTGDQGTLTYRVTQHSLVHGPSHIRPGLVRIAVTGRSGHSLQLARSRHGAGRGTLAADVNALGHTGKALRLEHDFRLYGGAEVGSTLWVTLKPGRYFFVDSAPQTISAAKIRVIRVSGKTSHAAGYHRSGNLLAVHEMDWSKIPASIPAAGNLRFLNVSSDTHFVVLTRLRPGKTLSDVKKVFTGQESGRQVFYGGAGSNWSNGVISPQRSETVSYDLHAGRYVVACFWPDENGVPHALMGMLRTIRLH